MLSIFSHAYWPFVFFGQMSIKVCSILNWMVCFLMLSCMKYLKIKPLSVESFVNIFFHSVHCLFIILVVSFAFQKFVSLMRSQLFIFVFISITLGDWPKKMLVRLMSENVLYMLSSRSFMVSSLMFKPLSHFLVYLLCCINLCLPM